MAALCYIKCAICMVLGGVFLVFFWPLGLVFSFLAFKALGEANDAANRHLPYDEPSTSPAVRGRTMGFGPGGPPWGDAEPPLVLDGRVIFVPSIRSITEWSAAGSDWRVQNGIRTPIPGTARTAYVSVDLHSGDSFSARGQAADRLRTWFDRIAMPVPPLTCSEVRQS